MWALLLTGGKKFAGWIVAALSMLVMFMTVWHTSKKVGKAEGRADAAEQREDENADRAAEAIKTADRVNDVENAKVDTANETRNDVNVLPDGAASKRLHDKWSSD